MKLCVNKDLCLGCGACCACAPDVFEIGEDGFATVKVDEIEEEFMEDAMDAKDGCPTSAIEEVNEEEIEKGDN